MITRLIIYGISLFIVLGLIYCGNINNIEDPIKSLAEVLIGIIIISTCNILIWIKE